MYIENTLIIRGKVNKNCRPQPKLGFRYSYPVTLSLILISLNEVHLPIQVTVPAHRSLYIHTAKSNRLMVVQKTVAFYSGGQETVNTLCGQNAKFLVAVKADSVMCMCVVL